MLINAMITRIERENMIELSGIGVPIVLTCNVLVRCFTLPYFDRNLPSGTMTRKVGLDL
jgi:hypothetical protein